jgi:hypothetical protein
MTPLKTILSVTCDEANGLRLAGPLPAFPAKTGPFLAKKRAKSED